MDYTTYICTRCAGFTLCTSIVKRASQSTRLPALWVRVMSLYMYECISCAHHIQPAATDTRETTGVLSSQRNLICIGASIWLSCAGGSSMGFMLAVEQGCPLSPCIMIAFCCDFVSIPAVHPPHYQQLRFFALSRQAPFFKPPCPYPKHR